MWAAPDFPLRRGPFAASRARVRMSVPWPAGTAQKRHGRPPIKTDIEELVVRLARENPAWGYDRIAGAVHNLGHQISDQTVGNILQRQGFGASPERRRNTTWASFIRQHKDVLWATDFFTTEIWTR